MNAAPDRAEAHFNLGIAYTMQDAVHKAIHAYQKAIALDPMYGKAYLMRAMVQSYLANDQKALADVTQAINIIQPNRGLWPEVSLVKRDVLLTALKLRAMLRNKMGDVAGGAEDEQTMQSLQNIWN